VKNARELRVEAEFNRQRAQDPSLQSKQFSVTFNDGKTIFCRPELMEKVNGFPVPNYEKYLRQHHPERLNEYNTFRDQREGEIRRKVDEPLRNNQHSSPFQSFFDNNY
jgi:hypothetical protein